MRILYPLGSFYPSQSGGPNNTIYWITSALVSKGLKPIVVTTNDGIKTNHGVALNEWLNLDYGKVRYVETKIHYLPIKAFYHILRQLPHIDVIHLTSVFYPLSLMTAFVNRLFFKKPVIWSPRGELDPEALIYSKRKKKIVLKMIRFFLLNKVKFHATCASEEIYIKNTFKKSTPTILIPNYMPIESIESQAEKDKTLIYLGRLHPKKAIENLVKSLRKSAEFLRHEYKLLVLGKGDNGYEKKLKQIVQSENLEDKVRFLGHVEGDEKNFLLKKAKCLVMPSHTENFGNVAIEALSCFTPVIASFGTPWEILEKSNSGKWVSNDESSLAIAIDEIILMNTADYDKMCTNARNLVVEQFEINANIDKWISAYNAT